MSSPTDPTPARVLVADDQPDVLEALRWLLTGEGYEPQFVSSTDAVIERLRGRALRPAADGPELLRDTTSGREGLELIPRVRAHDAALPIVVMTGWGSIDTAVEAMRRGAQQLRAEAVGGRHAPRDPASARSPRRGRRAGAISASSASSRKRG